jgi:gamma-glutamylcyclotransferase (GGCT)/AIG2-like uncharacterized protein YtfP
MADEAGPGRRGAEGLFVYGTLRFPDVLRAILGRVPDLTPATARGWRVAALLGRRYPGLVVDPDGCAAGLLLTGLTADEQRILDAFEDDLYDLRRLPLDGGRHGWAYVWTADAEVAADDWDPERFTEQHLSAYVGRCVGWRDLYGAE